MQEKGSTALALPDRNEFIAGIKAVNEFQQVAHQFLIEGADWGVIPGTTKPTLLKPGAEKIAKLLGLADTYEILDRQEDWQKPFFRYIIRCKLVSVRDGIVISEGLGECNSMESKYRWRWVGERDLPQGTDTSKLVKQDRKSTKTGGHWTVYRLDNEDIYSQVNTILKMAKKRSLVDAALSAGRLSDVFTQDIEDIPDIVRDEVVEKPKEAELSPIRKQVIDKLKGKKEPEPSPDAPPATTEVAERETSPVAPVEKEQPAGIGIDMNWVRESMKAVKWTEVTIKSYLANVFKISKEGKLEDVIARLNREQKEQLTKEIQDRLEMV